MKVTILGCGSAAGTPSVSGGWGKCDPANPKNRRRRASILVEEGPTSILVDTSPDLRDQMLSAGLRRLDAVIYTHAHADHIHGIDELREINRIMQAPIPCYAPPETLQILETRFAYVFKGIPPESKFVFRPWLIANDITPAQTFSVGNVTVRPFIQDHGFSTTVGYSFGDVVYSTDLVDLPPAARAVIKNAKVWIVGALSDDPYPSHAHVGKVLEWIDELKPQRAVITHMSNALDYDKLIAQLPVGVTPAFDGLVIET
jgi:phosphoribosyl 1,2-cyclic phosphate phosphodiesterase